VTDAISRRALTSGSSFWDSSSVDRPGDILNQLHRILSSCRGGYKPLVQILCTRIAEVQDRELLLIEPSSRIIEEDDMDEQWRLESGDSINSEIDFGVSMAMGSMEQQCCDTLLERQEQPLIQDFNDDQTRQSLTPKQLSSSSDDLSPPLTQLQQTFPFSSWDFFNTSNNIIQNPGPFNPSFGTATFPLSGAEAIQAQGIDRWDMWADARIAAGVNVGLSMDMAVGVAVGMGMDGMGSAPEAVEQWN
jgi:hypothetical protein